MPTAPDPAAVEAFAEALLSARSPVIVCGGGVVIAGAEAELQRLAEMTGAVVATTISGQGPSPTAIRWRWAWSARTAARPRPGRWSTRADLVLFIGCRAGSVTTERWRHPEPGKVRVLHIDVDPAVPGANYPTEVSLVADARLALAAVNAALVTREVDGGRRRSARRRVAEAKAQKQGSFLALARSDETPIRPERLVAALQELLPEDSVIVADPGTPCPYFSAYYHQAQPGRRFISNRAHGALGYSPCPRWWGLRIGRPGAKCVAVMGDGSFGMACGELETIVRLRLPVTLVVVSNGVYGWIKAGQKTGFGERYFSVDFGRSRHAAIAQAFGHQELRGERSGAAQAHARQGARGSGADTGRRAVPAAARGARTGERVGGLSDLQLGRSAAG